MGIVDYLKETQGELRHVAWPTRTQTIVYTILVALISVGVALYLGLFDYIFTTGLTHLIGIVPSAPQTQTLPSQAVTITQSTTTGTAPAVQFALPTTTTK